MADTESVDDVLADCDDVLDAILDDLRTAHVKPPAARIRQQHLARLLGVRVGRPRSAVARAVTVSAVILLGLLLMGGGMAAADLLPPLLQDRVGDAVSPFGLDLPSADDESDITDHTDGPGQSEDAPGQGGVAPGQGGRSNTVADTVDSWS